MHAWISTGHPQGTRLIPYQTNKHLPESIAANVAPVQFMRPCWPSTASIGAGADQVPQQDKTYQVTIRRCLGRSRPMLLRYSQRGSSFSSRFSFSNCGALARHTAICTMYNFCQRI